MGCHRPARGPVRESSSAGLSCAGPAPKQKHEKGGEIPSLCIWRNEKQSGAFNLRLKLNLIIFEVSLTSSGSAIHAVMRCGQPPESGETRHSGVHGAGDPADNDGSHGSFH